MVKRLWLFLACLALTAGMAFAQQKVTGTVIDRATGEPVVGASVRVKGTSIGDATDVKGNFTITNVPNSAKILHVSYIGMKDAEVAVKPKVKIYMESNETLTDEVLVLAYGTQKKSAFTGSATVIKAEEIAQEQSTNVLNALNGKSAGVQMFNSSGQPGQTTPTIRIRGISSISAGNAPLIIMDGAPYDGDLNTINPQDVESMTVLKDAASNALYGARGANGVIMITTKKAQAGNGAKVTVDAKWGSNSRATQRYKTINNPAHYYETYYKALKNYSLSMGNSELAAHEWANANLTAQNGYGLYYNVYDVPAGQYMIGVNGKLNPNAKMGNIVNYGGQDYLLKADDWMDAAYSNALRQEYNVSASNASGPNSFYMSVGYLKNEGITANSDYERISGRLKADSQLKSWLKMGANVSFAHYSANAMTDDGVDNSSGNIFAVASQVAPIYPLFIRDRAGNVLVDNNGIKRYDYGDKENAGLERPVYTQTNALSDAILNTQANEGNAVDVSAFAEIRFLKDFKFTTTNGVNLDENRTSYVTNPYYGTYSSQNGIVTKYHTRVFSKNFQQLLTWRHIYGLHDIEVMVGHEAYDYRYYYLSANKSGMFDPTNNELDGAIIDGSSGSYTTRYNTEGWFGRAQYNYEEKYFGSFSFRRDASSNFHPDNRWGSFWSFGAAWLINKENWFNVNWVNLLKLKASYGEQGNDAIGYFRYTNTYVIDNSASNSSLIPSTMGNKDISWEKNGNFNIGVEFELLGSRLNGSVEYFYRKTSDMLSWFTLPGSFGYTGYYANVGDMRNLGVELDLNADIIRTKEFKWNVNVNFTHYRNKITYLDDTKKTTTIDGKSGYESSNYFYGENCPLYTFSTKKFAGVDPETGESLWWKNKTENVLDADGNVVMDKDNNPVTKVVKEKTNKYSEASNYLCGTALPDAYGGFGTSLSYKGFDLSMDFVYQLGGQCLDTDYMMAMSSPTSTAKGRMIHADILKAWTPENKNSKIPRYQFGDEYTAAQSDRFLVSASYLSLQNINFGYTLPLSLTRPAGVDKVRVYVSADNVWLWSKRQGLDPRQSISGATTSAYYAPIRSISGGITITF